MSQKPLFRIYDLFNLLQQHNKYHTLSSHRLFAMFTKNSSLSHLSTIIKHCQFCRWCSIVDWHFIMFRHNCDGINVYLYASQRTFHFALYFWNLRINWVCSLINKHTCHFPCTRATWAVINAIIIFLCLQSKNGKCILWWCCWNMENFLLILLLKAILK